MAEVLLELFDWGSLIFPLYFSQISFYPLHLLVCSNIFFPVRMRAKLSLEALSFDFPWEFSALFQIFSFVPSKTFKNTLLASSISLLGKIKRINVVGVNNKQFVGIFLCLFCGQPA